MNHILQISRPFDRWVVVNKSNCWLQYLKIVSWQHLMVYSSKSFLLQFKSNLYEPDKLFITRIHTKLVSKNNLQAPHYRHNRKRDRGRPNLYWRKENHGFAMNYDTGKLNHKIRLFCRLLPREHKYCKNTANYNKRNQLDSFCHKVTRDIMEEKITFWLMRSSWKLGLLSLISICRRLQPSPTTSLS